MSDIWNKKIEVGLTIRELEEIALALRIVGKASGDSGRSELEDRLSHIVVQEKMKF